MLNQRRKKKRTRKRTKIRIKTKRTRIRKIKTRMERTKIRKTKIRRMIRKMTRRNRSNGQIIHRKEFYHVHHLKIFIVIFLEKSIHRKNFQTLKRENFNIN